MKIAFVMPAFVPALDYGGPVSKYRSLIGQLQSAGVDCDVWTSDFGLGRSRTPPGRRVVEGIPVRYFRRLFAYRWSPVAPQVAIPVLRFNGDLVHICGYRDGLTLPAAIACMLRGRPYVVEPMGMAGRRKRSLVLKRVVDSLFGRRYFTSAAAVIVTSPQEADDVKTLAPAAKIRFRTNPVPPKNPTDKRDPSDRSVRALFVGRLAQIKNLETVALAVKSSPILRLEIVGPYEDPAVVRSLEQIARGSDGRVKLLGEMYGADLEQAYASADVFILASHSESFGISAVEAATAGLPVVLSRGCGVASLLESVGAATVLADAESTECVRETLESFRGASTSERLPTQVIDAIRAVTDPPRVAKDQIAIYEDAIDASISPPRTRQSRLIGAIRHPLVFLGGVLDPTN